MNAGSIDSPKGDSSGQLKTYSQMWDRYIDGPDCYDGVALAIQRSWLGIAVAGGIVASLAYFATVAVSAFTSAPSSAQWIFSLMMAAVLLVIGALVAAFWSVFSILTVLTLNFFFWEAFDRRTGVAVCGGGAGFLASYWPMYNYLEVSIGMGGLFVSFVFVAMASCQIGALFWGGREKAFESPRRNSDSEPVGFQFKITHIMIAMIWFGVLFWADGFFEYHQVLLMFGVYVVFQTFLLLMDWVLFRRSKQRRLT